MNVERQSTAALEKTCNVDGYTFNDVTKDAAFYTTTSRFVS